MAPALESVRLTLRAPDACDAEVVRAYYVRNEARFTRWDPARSHELAAYERWIANLTAARDPLVFLTFERHAPKTLVGEVVLSGFGAAPPSAMVSYTVDAAFEGCGFASEAVATVLAYARSALGIRTFSAHYDPTNLRSERLLQRLGFLLGGHMPVVAGLEHLMRSRAIAVLQS